MAGDGTRCVGHPTGEPGEPVHPGPVLSSTFHLGTGDEPYFYGRAGNPTWTAYESAIGALEGGHCVAFASGMAAVSTVLRLCARPGTAVVLPSDGYYVSRLVASEELAPLGVEVREFATAGSPASFAGATLVLVETPSNPGLEVCDIRALADAAHEAGALLAVDNTTATPLGQRPIPLGADFVISSDTKAIAGHGDVLMGHVTCSSAALAEQVTLMRTRGGAIPGPFETWLAHRGLATLDLRLERQARNAHALVQALLTHPAAADVRWPGLPSDRSHEIASRQMRRWNGVLRFTLPSARAVEQFLEASSLVVSSTSFGGVNTSADRRARWGDAVPEGLLRLSAGIEDTNDLVDDVLGALDRVRT
ncbi:MULTISPECIES: cystathionine gamma-lyase [Pseudonocardia]|uniref:Cystathionine gamma-lyase n=1 Tax=Pseudonocardia oroxyli TaxID=366584 RepID=A0A1G7ZE35_PSEOR|nr:MULTISPECIES: cystathionine gamma-lyase [Pseudonocardia]MCF7553819.1 cystathionine gamma-lyase [Pseudonocardia sp. WMMC193]SDH06817.1 cystathionine gamma-lyase [Pseudonocardia oroxyli]